uniref:Uncharacterized protein n=1 Tax=Sphaerodactylus townsendi TaxID=933632 RepID=A0ACB8ER31_9SAUR
MARRTVSTGRLEVCQDFAILDSEGEVLELPTRSRVRLTFVEDARAHKPPDLAELEGATAMPLGGAQGRDPSDQHEPGGATTLSTADERRPPVSDLWEQLEALERTKCDWEQEREALESWRGALELERETGGGKPSKMSGLLPRNWKANSGVGRPWKPEIITGEKVFLKSNSSETSLPGTMSWSTFQLQAPWRGCLKALESQGEIEAALQRRERDKLQCDREALTGRERELAAREALLQRDLGAPQVTLPSWRGSPASIP